MTDAALVTRRTWAGALIVVGVVVTAGLGVHYANQHDPGRIDVSMDSRLQRLLGDHRRTLGHIITLADPRNVAIACVAIGALFFWRGRRRLALLSLLGPLVTVALTDLVLKPLINRRFLGKLSFPSGHTAASVAIATVVVVGLLGASGPAWPAVARWLVVVAVAAIALVVAVSLVAAGYHYATDTIGGAALAIAVVMASALAIDGAADRIDSRRALRVRSDLPRRRRTR